MSAIETAFRDANATRYLSGIGLVLLLWDHVLTFREEVQLIWRARPSFAKYAFLINRYLVAGNLITAAFFMNHFSNEPLKDSTISVHSCRNFFAFSSVVGVASIGMANVLVILRVLTLWDRDRRVKLMMSIGFMMSFLTTMSTMIVAVMILKPGIQYEPEVHMCVTTTRSSVLTGVWAAPMVFEIFVLLMTFLNAFGRPRESHTALSNVLRRDGITFFLSLTVLRTLNLIASAIAPALLTMLSVFFVWAMTTLVLNRSLLNIQKAETARPVASVAYLATGRASPFGIEPADRDVVGCDDFDCDSDDDESQEEWEMRY